MKRAWAIALLAGSGVTLLVPSAISLVAPPSVLDAAAREGDLKLWGALAALFAVSTLVARVALVRRRTQEDEVVEPAPAPGGGHLR